MNTKNGNNHELDPKQPLVRLRLLLAHVWGHFREDRCLEEAASLSYTSLLALVPLLAVIFGIVSAFPVFNEWSDTLRGFIFENLVPAVGSQVETYITSFLDSISSLTLPGTIVLIITALLLMFRIEVAFNLIWRVKKSRGLTNRIVMYWAVLTLGPILAGAAIALSAQKVFVFLGLEGGVAGGWSQLGTFVLGWMAFSMMFVLVPNRHVKFRDAIAGALLTALLFELARAGFVTYVRNANYNAIYGALATIPIFLFWLYIVWSVILFGASLAASLTTWEQERYADGDWNGRFGFQVLFRLVGHLWTAQRVGKQLSNRQLLKLDPMISESRLNQLLGQLERGDVVAGDQDSGWMLARDLKDFSLLDLCQAGEAYLPLSDIEDLSQDSEWDRVFVRSMLNIRDKGKSELNEPLRDMFSSSVPEAAARK
jgi:membrane protein